MRYRLPALFAASLVLALPAAAPALTIDFQALEHGGSGQQALPGTGKFYTEKGFDFQSSAPVFNFATWGTASPNYFGSTALWNGDGTGATGITTLTRADGGAFDLLSIDIAELNLTGAGVAGIAFEATFSGGGTTSTNFTTDGSRATGSLSSFETFSFTGFNDVVSVQWLQVTPFHQFDNVSVLNVPEPTTALLLATGLAGLAVRRRKLH